MSIVALDIRTNEQTGAQEFWAKVGGSVCRLDDKGAVRVAQELDAVVRETTDQDYHEAERVVRETVVENHRRRVADVQDRIAELEAELAAELEAADAAEEALKAVGAEVEKPKAKPAGRRRTAADRASLSVVKDAPEQAPAEDAQDEEAVPDAAVEGTPVEEHVPEPVDEDVPPAEEPQTFGSDYDESDVEF